MLDNFLRNSFKLYLVLLIIFGALLFLWNMALFLTVLKGMDESDQQTIFCIFAPLFCMLLLEKDVGIKEVIYWTVSGIAVKIAFMFGVYALLICILFVAFCYMDERYFLIKRLKESSYFQPVSAVNKPCPFFEPVVYSSFWKGLFRLFILFIVVVVVISFIILMFYVFRR